MRFTLERAAVLVDRLPARVESRAAHDLFRREPKDAFRAGVAGADTAVSAKENNPLLHGCYDRAIALLAFPQCPFGALLLEQCRRLIGAHCQEQTIFFSGK